MSILPHTSVVIVDGVVSDFSIGYDSDDSSFEILKDKADDKYGSNITKSGWRRKEEYTEFCKLTIDDFNSKNEDKMYVFEEIMNVNALYVATAGAWYYFILDARDTTVDAPAHAIMTFQANV
ncbi:hypothetical protein CQW23_21791 [Capsicum baccatum]|uniref:Cystatin domain-containing protein n=1 Tax=Capsicum baccatum TaxID=33114 RepID=A0A2G2VZ16_CAPBA|nr:hypothetical protein CQW23_21791 [Capsicum baccatum]